MDAKKLLTNDAFLRNEFFDEIKEGTFVLKKSPIDLSQCLSVHHAIIDIREDNLKIKELHFSINVDAWFQEFHRLLAQSFPSLKDFEVHSISDRERYLCLEFDKRENHTQHDSFHTLESRGIVGVKVSTECYGNRLEIQLTDFFAIGNSPLGLPAQLSRIFRLALDGDPSSPENSPNPYSPQVTPTLWEITPQKLLLDSLSKITNHKIDSINLSFQGAIREKSFETTNEKKFEYILHFSALSASKGEWVFDMEKQNSPIDILETRELRKKFSMLEEKLFYFDTVYLNQHMNNLLTKDPNSEYIQKRTALAYLSGTHSPAIQSYFLNLHPDDETPWILWSACIKSAIQSRNQDKTLNLIRSFLKVVLKNSLPLHSSVLFDSYIPESLADLIQFKSAEKAYELLKHVHQNRSEDAQIISKICNITARLGLKEEEKNWLQKAVGLNQDHPHLSPLLLRIAEIEMFSGNAPAAVNFALKAVKASPSNAIHLSAAADILVEAQKYQDALRVINDLLESPMINHASGADRALLYWKLGKIWLDKLGKVDLAKAKFESALECEPLHVATLLELREIFLKEEKFTPLAEVLKRLMEYFERNTNPEQFQNYRSELVELYKNHLNNLNEHEIEKNLFENRSVKSSDQEDTSRLLENEPNMDIWTYPEIDWQVYHDGLQNRLKSESLTPQERFKLRILLSDICQHKLLKTDWAIKHLMIAGEHDFIREDQFMFLLDNYSSIQDPKLFSSVVLKQLVNISEKAKQVVLEKIVVAKAILDEPIRQNLTWDLYSFDPISSFKYLFEMIQKHFEASYQKLLLKDFQLFSKNIHDPNQKEILLEFFYEKIVELDPHSTPEATSILLELILENPPESVETLQSLTRYCQKHSKQTELRVLCETLLNRALLPAISEKSFLELFNSDKISIGLYYELRAAQNKNNQTQALKDLESALSYYSEESTASPRILKLLTEWYQSHEANIETIKKLINLSNETINVKMDLLEKQFDLHQGKYDIQMWLLDQAIQLHSQSPTRNLEELSKYLHRALDILHATFQVKENGFNDRSYAKWYDVWVQAMNLDTKPVFIRIANDILSNEDSIRDYKKILLFFEALRNQHSSWAETLLSIMDSKIDLFLKEEKYFLAGVYAEFFKELGVQSETTEKSLLIYYLQEKLESKLEPLLATMLKKFSPIDAFYTFLETQRQIFLSSGFRKNFDKILIQFLQDILKKETLENFDYDKSVEIILMLKTYHESFDSMNEILEKLWVLDSNDSRIWTLCFYSFRQFADKITFKNFLLQLQEKLQTNPSDYSNLKINLEMIHQELEDLKNTPSFKNWRDLFHSNSFDSLDQRKKLLYLQTLNANDRLRCFQALVVRCEDTEIFSEVDKIIPDQIIWRHTSKIKFDMNAKDRVKGIESELVLNSDTYKLLLSLSPSFSRIFRTRYNLKYLKNYLSLSSYKDIQKAAVQVSWKSDDLNSIGLHHFEGRIARNGYKFFNLNGLKGKVFFDLPSKSFYFDLAHYRNLPPTHLRYEILDLMWQNKLGYATILGLHPEKQIAKSIKEIQAYIESTPFEKLQSLILRTESDPFHILQGMDQESLKKHLQSLSQLQSSEIENIQNAMRRRIYLCMLAESLDLIGILEWSENLNLVDEPSQLENLYSKPVTKYLFENWLKLK